MQSFMLQNFPDLLLKVLLMLLFPFGIDRFLFFNFLNSFEFIIMPNYIILFLAQYLPKFMEIVSEVIS
jgi:hypothetical protein